MKTYSPDLRQRVLSAALRGNSIIPEVTELFGVNMTFVNKMLRLHRASSDLAPRPHAGDYVARPEARHHTLLRAAVAANNDATLGEVHEHSGRRARIEVGKATVSRVLMRFGLLRKKSMRAAKRNNYKRGWFRRRV